MSPTPPTVPTSSTDPQAAERRDLLEALGAHRGFLRQTVRDLTDEQAAAHPTVSALCLGGIVKHLATIERQWVQFVVEGPTAFGAFPPGPAEVQAWTDQHRMLPGETLAGLLAEYDEAAAATDVVVATVELDRSHPLPSAPWFAPGATRSARRVFVHLIGETAQHAGHADILRESIDGARTMG